MTWTKELPIEEGFYWIKVGESVLLCEWRSEKKEFHLPYSTYAKVKWDFRAKELVETPHSNL